MISFLLLCSVITSDGGIYWSIGNIDKMYIHSWYTNVIIDWKHWSDMSSPVQGKRIHNLSDCKLIKK